MSADDPMSVSDHELAVLEGAGLVIRTAEGLEFVDKTLEFHCTCGDWKPHHFAPGGLYIPCNKCKINTILYFDMPDLARHLESGAVRVRGD